MMKKKETAGEKSKAAKSASRAGLKAIDRPAKKASTSPSPKASTPVKSNAAAKQPAKRATRRKAAPVVDLDALGSLPHGYGTDTVFLVAQEPNWLFTYWDIDISRHPGGPCHLRVEDDRGVIVQEIAVPFETRNWYVPVKEAGKTYTVEIGYYRGRGWKSIARSMPVATPRNRLSESDRFNFATIPLHMSFQRLVETITHSISGERNLVPALAQLQEALSSAAMSSGFPLQQREKAILMTLLGSGFVAELSSARLGSEELHSAIYQRLRERLSSGELGELVGRLQLGQAESSLFSMFPQFAAEFATGSWSGASAEFTEQLVLGLSSWLASWSAAALSSWGAGASEMLQIQSSWSGMETGSMETLASWSQLSSWLAAVGSSWSGLNLSSMELAALSSWTSSAMSSWGAASGGSVSSWGGTVDSFGFATARTPAPGLDLRAEITLRGQTDPRARLVVAGSRVDVGEDGSFEHTLRFEEGRGEISIEAISPDGSQTRRTAILLQPASI